MTDSTIKPDNTSKPQPERLSLSLTQVLASVLAAVSASVAASTFGVAGTVIGAALGSAVTVVGSAVYAQSLKRSREAVRLTLGVAATKRLGGRNPAPVPSDPDDLADDERPVRRGHRLRLALTPQRLALGAGALFVVTLALITGFELLTGQPVAASVDGKPGSGVSLLGGVERSHTSPAPASPASTARTSTTPAVTPQSPSGSSAPRPTVTVTITPTAPASASPSPTSTAPSSPAGGSGSATPSTAGGTASGAGTPGGG